MFSVSVNERWKNKLSISDIHVFMKATLFFSSLSVLFNFLINWASNVASLLLNTCRHHLIETFFMSSIFISMSMSTSGYICFWYRWSIFHYRFHFHCNWSHNLIKLDTLVITQIFWNMSYYFFSRQSLTI